MKDFLIKNPRNETDITMTFNFPIVPIYFEVGQTQQRSCICNHKRSNQFPTSLFPKQGTERSFRFCVEPINPSA